MANSYVELTANGSATSFSFSFSYIDSSDIALYVDGVVTAFTFTSSNTLSVTTAPTSGAIVRIERTTDSATRLVDFSDGSILTEADLDSSAQQVFNLSQEAVDKTGEAIYKTPDGKMDVQSRVLKNVATGVNANDAVTKGQLNVEYPDIQAVASKATEIGRLGTTSTVADMTALGVSTVVADMGVLADVEDGTTATNALKTLAEVQDGTVATNALKTLAEIQDGTVATNAIKTVADDSGKITALNSLSTTIGLLGANSVLSNMSHLGQAQVVSDMDLLADLQDGTIATNALKTIAELEDGTVATNAIQDVAGIQANVTTVAGIQANVTTVASKNTEIGLLGVGSTVADMSALGVSTVVADMSLLGTADNVADMGLLADLQNGAVATNALKTLAEIQDGTVATNAIKTVADDPAKITTLNGLSTEINALGALSTEISNLGNNATLQSDIALLGSSSVVADIETLADVQDGTIVSNGLSELAATTTDIDKIFLYAVKDELLRFINSLPPGDSYLSTWLQANHTDGYARADFNTDGSIDALNDLVLHVRYLLDLANATEIATWTARIGTPAQNDATIYAKYLNPNAVLPPFWTLRLNVDDVATVASSIITNGLPVLVFSINGNGLVPAPTQAEINGGYLLCADGTWKAP